MTERERILRSFSQSEREWWEKIFGESFPIKSPPEPSPVWRPANRLVWVPSPARLRKQAAQVRSKAARVAAKAKFVKATDARLAAAALKLEGDPDLQARVLGHQRRVAAEQGRTAKYRKAV